MSDKFRKTVVPKDDYPATIVHAEFKPNLFLFWTIDTGKHIDHTISQEIFISEFGVRQLDKMCRRMKISYHGDLLEASKVFPMQFLSRRAVISVDIKARGDFIRNVITYHQVVTAPPERNVIKPKSVDHFYAEKTQKRLPIQ